MKGNIVSNVLISMFLLSTKEIPVEVVLSTSLLFICVDLIEFISSRGCSKYYLIYLSKEDFFKTLKLILKNQFHTGIEHDSCSLFVNFNNESYIFFRSNGRIVNVYESQGGQGENLRCKLLLRQNNINHIMRCISEYICETRAFEKEDVLLVTISIATFLTCLYAI